MKAKQIIMSLLCIAIAVPAFNAQAAKNKGRKQWTEKQAWEWEKKVGPIKGFNVPAAGYPGMTRNDIIKKCSEYGLNSVRFWINGNTPEEQIQNIRDFAADAEQYGMTISPVLSLQRTKEYFSNPDKELGEKNAEKAIKQILEAFKDDPRIILWDIWNEPNCDIFLVDGGTNAEQTRAEVECIEKMVKWCWEVGVSQPITSSIFFDSGADADVTSDLFKYRAKVEGMMDLHNFHSYACSNESKDIDFTLAKLRGISNRPLVCTECLTRVNGSGVGRTLTKFADEHVHFYIWGSFVSDANWSVKWLRSTYDPYEVIFHNTMYADGDYIDYREIEMLRNFTFSKKGETADPGLEYTERWSHERAWKRMACGPVKGVQLGNGSVYDVPDEYNSVRIKFNYADWKADKDAFFAKFDNLIKQANQKGITILPVLVDDKDVNAGADELYNYVSSVVFNYYYDPAIQAWDLYWHPGEKCADNALVSQLVTTVFKAARNCYANQPLTATPLVKVKDFAPDFDYHSALIHGRRAGWDKLEYPAASDVELVNKIWSLSDVVSFSTEQPQAEAGWLLSICYRYGRPIFCMDMSSPSSVEAVKTLERFGMSHVFWYTGKALDASVVKDFKFLPIVTKH